MHRLLFEPEMASPNMYMYYRNIYSNPGFRYNTIYGRNKYQYRQPFYVRRQHSRGLFTWIITKKPLLRSKIKYITEPIKFGSNILKPGVRSVNYLSLPSFGIKEDEREKSCVMLRSVYITGSVKVMKLLEQNMMVVDDKSTYVLQGVFGVFIVKDYHEEQHFQNLKIYLMLVKTTRQMH